MKKVLYITAHPLDPNSSYSLAVGKEFIDTYREAHPEEEVIHLDLFQLDVPAVDADILNARYKLFQWRQANSNTPFEQLLSDAERDKLAYIDKLCDQFIEADKYIFVSPMWNLTIPHVLLNYTNCLVIPGKTYRYTETGPVGLLAGKKALHIQASGGVYSEGPAAFLECGASYIRTIMQFIGVADIQSIFIEGMAEMPDQAEAIKQEAIVKARETAKQF
ncbi:FMN-dependent NADH-azoreductase [Paenibacillus sp. HN-1]|uniref:FMN-dependent NADH-azoreductase n=1 Tax=Paenibacillus TaxID=44249 RepID=UPI001CA96A8A|nr:MULTISPECIES: FMN-dependent NADH-azoreductase [Paenibacillus]MBY9080681.1 FMN-dependent NADH-azoreductase [Paenibacillus sp. CGMCC 1.18879]MBY9085374.1 FMN-dependent NADH-azoreductase [Paenibacillus sinensis]